MTEQNSEKENQDQKDQKDQDAASSTTKTVRRVVVTHLDEPPPSGKTQIHPRRRAPIVPTREERTGEHPDEDTKAGQSESE